MNKVHDLGPRALVTGGSGVLGRALVRELVDRGAKVRIFDLSPPPPEPGDVEFVRGNVSQAEEVSDACRGCSTVFHLAARMPQACLSEEAFREVNVLGTRHVAEACVRSGVPALIFASTIEMYGPRKDFPIREDAAKGFTGIYSRNKWESERMLLEIRERHGLRVSMLRMPMILGAGFYHEQSVLEMMRRVRHHRPLPLPGGPEIPFTAVAATDAARAFLAAAELDEADGEAFNITAGPGEPTRALFSRFIREVGSRSRVIPIPRWIVSPAVSLAVKLGKPLPMLQTPAELLPFALTGGDYDISKARARLGYEPRKGHLTALVEMYHGLARENRI